MSKRNIFVFGSNLKGIHGAGQALTARQIHGAELGVGEGLTGDAYALPTKITPYESRSLEDIKISVDKFIEFAKSKSDWEFFIPRIGCGRAGFTDKDIGPLFSNVSENCIMPESWSQYIPSTHRKFHDHP